MVIGTHSVTQQLKLEYFQNIVIYFIDERLLRTSNEIESLSTQGFNNKDMKSFQCIVLYSAFIMSTFISCVSTPGESEFVTYTTRHFIIRYEDRYFTDYEIAVIGEKKERLLVNIAAALDVDFDDQITTYLFYEGEQYAYVYNGITYESRDYVLQDDGHEIAHIVSFSKIGRSNCNFLVEGLAVSLEYRPDTYNAIEDYLTYKPSSSDKKSDSLSITRQILENRFDYSYYSYRKAGAFLCYLSNTYGVDALKEFYSESCKIKSSELELIFSEVFGLGLKDAENNFNLIRKIT